VAYLIVSEEGKPTLETILILFDMLFDRPNANNKKILESGDLQYSSNELEKIYFDNMIFLPIILKIVPFCEKKVQQFILSTLHSMLIGECSLVNLSKCSQMQPPLVDVLLDLILALNGDTVLLAAELLQIMGRHSITVAQLKRIFRLMQSKGGRARPKYTSLLLRSLKNMVDESVCPKHFFVFEGGYDSGLRIPPIIKWPAPSGFAFSTWFCVEKANLMHSRFEHSSNDAIDSKPILSRQKSLLFTIPDVTYRPTILSFRQVSGIGIEIYLVRDPNDKMYYSLVVQSYKEADAAPTKIEISSFAENGKKERITEGTWYFIAVSHTASHFLQRKSEISVLINGSFNKFPLSFPRFVGEIEEPLIGNCALTFQLGGAITAMRGQMGSIYLFSEAISETQMRKLYALGMNTSKEFDNAHMANRKSSGEAQQSTFLESLSSSIMLAYNPGVWDGNYFLDNTPEKNSVKWGVKDARAKGKNNESGLSKSPSKSVNANFSGGPKMHAIKLAGTFRCTFQDMRDALDCLGGKKILIPLFAQFDLPIEGENFTDQTINSNICVDVIEFFFSLLRDSPDGRQFMSSYGFEVLSYFLEQVSPVHITMTLLDVFLDNIKKVVWKPEWHSALVKCILCNFRLWMHAPYEVQFKLIIFLCNMCKSNPSGMRDIITVPELFEALLVVYSLPSQRSGLMKSGSKGEMQSFDSKGDLSSDYGNVEMGDEADEFEETSAFSPRSKSNDPRSSSGNSPSHNLSVENLDTIRSVLFDMIYTLMTLNNSLDSKTSSPTSKPVDTSKKAETPSAAAGISSPDLMCPSPREVECVIHYITYEPFPRFKVQGLQLLINLLKSKSPQMHQRLIAGLSIGSKLHPIIALHSNISAKVRLYAFLVVCNVFHIIIVSGVLPESKTVKETVKVSVANDNTTTVNDAALDNDDEDNIFTAEECDDLGAETTTTTAGSNSLSPKPTPKQPKNDFDSVGVPVNTLKHLTLWMQEKLQALMENELCNPLLIDHQCRIIINIFYQTVLGNSSTRYVSEIEELFNSFSEIVTSPSYDSEYGNERHSDVSMMSEPPRNDFRTMSFSMFVSNDYSSLSESHMCLPLLLPAILRYINHDSVHYSLRFSVLVAVKALLQSFSNSDLYLQVDQWQIPLFELITAEQRRIKLIRHRMANDENNFHSYSNSRELDRSQGILDTGLHLLSNLFLHGIEYGIPTADFTFLHSLERKPEKLNIIQVVQSIHEGKRILGVKVLKDMMSYFRWFAEQGEIDFKEVGGSLLQHIANALYLKRENMRQPQADEKPLQRVIRVRMFNIACWLTTSFILDLLTTPIVEQPASKKVSKRRFSWKGSSLDDGSVDGFNTPKSFSGFINVNSNEFPTPLSMGDSSSVTNKPNQKGKRAMKIDPTSLCDIIEDSNIDNEASILSSSIDRAKLKRELSYSLSPPMSPTQDRLTLDGPVIRQSSTESEKISKAQPQNSFNSDEMMWGLLDSMLSLLETLESVTVTNPKENLIRIAFTVGVKAAQNVVNMMNETIEESIPAISSGQSSLPGTHVLVGDQISQDKIYFKISWRLVRVLCNTYSEICMSGFDINPSTQSWHKQALQRLKSMIASLEDRDAASYEFETIFTIAKLCSVLRHTPRSPTDTWVLEGLAILQDLLTMQRDNIIKRLNDIGFIFEPDLEKDDTLPLSRFSFSVPAVVPENVDPTATEGRRRSVSSERISVDNGRISVSGRTSSISKDDRNSLSDLKSPTENSRSSFRTENTKFFPDEMKFHSTEIKISVADTVIEAINIVLRIPDTSFLTWSIWDSAIGPVLTQGMAMEDESLVNSLQENMTKSSHNIFGQFDKLQSLEDAQLRYFSKKCQTHTKHILELMSAALDERVLRLESSHKRHSLLWNSILTELANERGPWGIGVSTSQEVSKPHTNEFNAHDQFHIFAL
jgi:hypothetical protein